MKLNPMNICTIESANPLEYRSFAAELEIGDVTHFGIVEFVERLESGRVLVTYAYPGTTAVYKADTLIHVAK